jgi:hypothetical protein
MERCTHGLVKPQDIAIVELQTATVEQVEPAGTDGLVENPLDRIQL